MLRAPATSHAASLWEHATSQAEMTRTLLWAPHQSVAETRKVLRWFQSHMLEGEAWHWIIELQGEAIGEISVHFGDLPAELEVSVFERQAVVAGVDQVEATIPAAEIGYFLSPSYWGRGIMTTAARATVRYVQDSCPDLRLWSRIDPTNIGSARVLERVGLTQQCVVADSLTLPNQGGKLRDTAYYLL